MHFPHAFVSYLVSFLDVVTLSSVKHEPPHQQPLQIYEAPASTVAAVIPPGPTFAPPYPPGDAPPDDVAIQCDYSAMLGWEKCNRPEDRGCWLKKGSENFTIDTNYEIRWPQGTTRKYTLDVAEMALAPDGVCMAHGKVFNGSYPGPWIQACWGDDIEITVRNNLWYNGTTIHWHGIRQWNTAEMDGVNAITQCPIAPGQSFTYKFKAIQYGSSWYHSHYSLQYADGLAGPMTIYGPSSAGYDHAIEPILMTDWNHRSAFEDWPILKGPPKMTNILLNGKGRYNYTNPNKPGLPIAQSERYSKVLKPGKKYLLRLINTSLDTHFVFSIDGHNVTVIGADFVPVKPYVTDSVRVGIGQRYHVVVEAVPIVKSANGNYWIRTTPAIACARFQDINPDDKTGIIRYDTNNTDDPTSASRDFSTECQDEPYKSLVPKVPWTVGKASNADADNQYFVNLRKPNIKGPWHPEGKSRWTAYEEPMWLNFSQPSIRYPNPGPGKPYPKWLDIVTHDPKGKDEWIYLVITLTDKKPSTGGKDSPFVPGGHPMHLHGHDFALLAASNDPYPGTLAQIEHKLKRDNPPRRDVVLLPTGGYIVIAFKADNPGPWLLHCHIAWHASSGLAFQILENMDKMKIPAASQLAMNETCKQWDKWVGEKKNLWNTTAEIEFQDDSGI